MRSLVVLSKNATEAVLVTHGSGMKDRVRILPKKIDSRRSSPLNLEYNKNK